MMLYVMSSIFFVLSLCSVFARATILDCSSACWTSTSKFQFTGSALDDAFYLSQCTNRHRVQSTFVCMRTYCGETEIESGLQEFSRKCESYGPVELLPWSVTSNISDHDTQSWTHVDTNDLGSRVIHTRPIFISYGLYDISFRTSAAWNDSVVTRANYSYTMFGFFAGVFLIANFARLLAFLCDRRRSGDVACAVNQYRIIKKLSLLVKRHITIPALFTHYTAQPVGWCTVPQRLTSLTIGAFILVNVVLCCVNYDVFDGNLNWPDPNTQFWRYFSDRTGVLVTANLPILFAFGMRNNILMWITGWNFLTCNMFHRWVSRVAMIEAILHSIGYTIEYGGKAEYVLQWHQQYWWMGVIATAAMCLLCGASIYPIRNLFYEIFLMLHIVLAITFLVGMWYHVAIFDGKYDPFIWPCVAVWALDRVIRFIRIYNLNYLSFTATANYNAEADLIRVKIPVKSSCCPKPGTYHYIYGLMDPRFWESHPFTLSNWSPNGSSLDQQILTFLTRPYDSYIARLRDSLVKQETTRSLLNENVRTRIEIEGPYGHSHTLEKYNSILFIVGGTGITVALSHIQALGEALEKNEKSCLPRIHIVWAVRDLALFEDVYKNGLAAWLSSSLPLSQKVNFKIDVYLTRQDTTLGKTEILSRDSPAALVSLKATRTPITEITPLLPQDRKASTSHSTKEIGIARSGSEGSSSSNSSSSATSPAPQISILNRRPPVRDLVLDSASESQMQGGRLVVVCCGPAAMADDTRAAIVAAYAQGYRHVDLHSEAFNW